MNSESDRRSFDVIVPDIGTMFAQSSGRLLVAGGIALIVVGMIWGDVFAAFVLHPNAGHVGAALVAATRAVAAHEPRTALDAFASIGGLLENRGTKVDAHVHMIDFGYLALLLAIVQPWVALSDRRKKQLAALLLSGAVLLPVGVFLIHYVGLAYSPLAEIGWASIIADFGGLLVIVACAVMLAGLLKFLGGGRAGALSAGTLLGDHSWASRALLCGGTLLVLAGFLHGAWYAASDLYHDEEQDRVLLTGMADRAAAGALPEALQGVNDYGTLQGQRAVKIAAHAHLIEFGLMAMLLAFVQPFVFLHERWKRRWVVVLLAGSVILPVFVQLEATWGLPAGGIADCGGLLVIIALLGMLAGVIRYGGWRDTALVATR